MQGLILPKKGVYASCSHTNASCIKNGQFGDNAQTLYIGYQCLESMVLNWQLLWH